MSFSIHSVIVSLFFTLAFSLQGNDPFHVESSALDWLSSRPSEDAEPAAETPPHGEEEEMAKEVEEGNDDDETWKSLGYDRFENVAWVESPANDGDSFYLDLDGKRTLCRLYQVDCAETAMSYPDRVLEQAEYFGISSGEALKLGKEAAEFTRNLLKSGQVTVYTRWTNARGSSGDRVYVYVRVNGRLLGEHLAEAGLVRIYGMRALTPDGRNTADYGASLESLERHAKREGRGGWKQ